MREICDRIWAPPESRVRIEYATTVMSQLSVEGANGDSSGILLGTRHGNTVRVIEAQASLPAPGSSPSHGYSETPSEPGSLTTVPNGIGLVGIFSVRKRGEVFLTDADLQRFEQTELALALPSAPEAAPTFDQPSAEETGDLLPENVALVVAGAMGGFFVRDHNGSIQAVRSYQEFQLTGGERDLSPSVTRLEGVRLRWSWVLLTALAAMIPVLLPPLLNAKLGALPRVPTAASRSEAPAADPVTLSQRGLPATPEQDLFAAGLRRLNLVGLNLVGLKLVWLRTDAPLGLTMRGGTEALRIAWNRFATADGARLEILDGAHHTIVPVSDELSSVTYEPESTDVEVQLTALHPDPSVPGEILTPHSERARFVSSVEPGPYGSQPRLDLTGAQPSDTRK